MELNMETVRLKEEKRRQFILNGPLWKVILMIALPLVLYNLCNYLYGIFDMMVVQNAGIGSAGSVVFLDQVKQMVSTLGAALSTAGGIIVAKRYGSGDIAGAKKAANTTFTICALIAIATLVIFVPFGKPFLELLKTDPSIIEEALGYFCMQMLVISITGFNNVFIAVEKAKGNTRKILYLNLGVVGIKILLSTIVAYGGIPNVDATWLAGATAIAQLFMFAFGLATLFSKKNSLGVSLRELNLHWSVLKHLCIIALPIFVGRFLFSFGKVSVQSIIMDNFKSDSIKDYAKMIVGALGISNTIAGLASNIFNSFEDATATVIAQNYGNRNGKRTIKAFKINLFYGLGIALVSTLFVIIFQNPIAEFFAPGDAMQQEMILNIVRYERLDIVFMGLHSAAVAILYGYAKTRVTMLLSISQIFLFRIPPLLFMIYILHMDYECSGIAMLFSNVMTGIVSLIYVAFFIRYLKRSKKYQMLFNKDSDS